MATESNAGTGAMLQTLLTRMNDMLADGKPATKNMVAAVSIDDALLRLKLWVGDLQKKSVRPFEIIQVEDKGLHRVINNLLKKLKPVVNNVEKFSGSDSSPILAPLMTRF
jgi:hypothetical protein